MAMAEPSTTTPSVRLCASDELLESAQAVPFDVKYYGQVCRGFAVRFQGLVHAYLNRCTHVPIELDYQPNRVFDATGQWLMCATHGATYWPKTGDCVGGPCRGGLVKIALSESAGEVRWHTSDKLKPIEIPHE
jgi:nitrite reductase/ring-hydroxylating ferredoxin subunit